MNKTIHITKIKFLSPRNQFYPTQITKEFNFVTNEEIKLTFSPFLKSAFKLRSGVGNYYQSDCI